VGVVGSPDPVCRFFRQAVKRRPQQSSQQIGFIASELKAGAQQDYGPTAGLISVVISEM
jgi:hypothetical protein